MGIMEGLTNTTSLPYGGITGFRCKGVGGKRATYYYYR
jgi:hypothetical protein